MSIKIVSGLAIPTIKSEESRIIADKELWVYIAGPYTQPDPVSNTAKACDMWDALTDLGFLPLCPHWSLIQHMRTEREYDFWIDYTMKQMKKCDSVLRIPGYSPGGDGETKESYKEGRPVFHSVEALIAWGLTC